MQLDEDQFNPRRRKRLSPALVLILVLAVVALGMSLTDQLREQRNAEPVFIQHNGTPGTELIAASFSTSREEPPDLAPLSDEDASELAVAAVARVQPAVITVQRAGEDPQFGQPPSADSAGAIGSGVIVSEDGYALASMRTTGTDGDIQVVFADGTSSAAEVIAVDEVFQLVLLKIDDDVPAVADLASYEPLPGERVLAIGSALDDFFSTVTGGVVGATGVTMPASGNWLPVRGAVQHDAAINEGNEGGPLLDLNGNVIGINIGSVTTSGDESAQGWSFAVPVSALAELLNSIA